MTPKYGDHKEGLYFIKPLTRNNFLDCMGYLIIEGEQAFLIRSESSLLEVTYDGKFEANNGSSNKISPMEIERCSNPLSMMQSYQRMVEFLRVYTPVLPRDKEQQSLAEIIKQLENMKPKNEKKEC